MMCAVSSGSRYFSSGTTLGDRNHRRSPFHGAEVSDNLSSSLKVNLRSQSSSSIDSSVFGFMVRSRCIYLLEKQQGRIEDNRDGGSPGDLVYVLERWWLSSSAFRREARFHNHAERVDNGTDKIEEATFVELSLG
jgi:hypothetical protein